MSVLGLKAKNIRMFAFAFSFGFVSMLMAQPGSDDLSLDLFTETTREAANAPSSEPGALRERLVDVRLNMFSDGQNGSPDRLAAGNVVLMNLFEDVVYTAVLDRVTLNNSGTLSWIGYLDEDELGSVTLVIDKKEGFVIGNISLPGLLYQIRHAGNGVHVVREIDPSAFPPDAEPIPVEGKEVKPGGPPPFRADSGAVIDVLVVYTAAARSAAGGTSSMNALVDLAVSETNTSYTNSGVSTQLNLVHKTEVSYTETGNFSTDLGRLKSKTDGYIDNVHSLRDTYCADEVVMITNGSQYCGIAYLMTSVSTSFEDSAFAVVARTCATGYFSFGHEIGHNMGARHDWYVDSSTSPYIYNHGYVKVNKNWRTIMAYNSECSANSTSCTRLQYWSNPNVTYLGDAMGVGGSTVGSSANNALALNNSLATVANFRDSTTSCSGTGGCSGTEYTGNLTGSNDYEYEPNGTYYYSSASGSHTAALEGPSGTDFDLYLWKWNGSSWSTVASSTSATSVENISYSGTSGYYVWRVFSYSGSGDYTLCATAP